MRRHSLRIVAFIALAVALAAVPVRTHAQSNDALRVTIPFAFHVGGKLLPAGEYTVMRTSNTSSGFLMQSADFKAAAAIVPSGSLQDRKYPGGRLVFNVYGSERFLSQIWMPWSHTGSAVKVSDVEERLAQLESRSVVVLAKSR